ncbi:MDIS1-interacting receptor like kinase 2 [Vitis vinifera]|uniref:non-specific serine/threonine protein kinase n=1 Tax=Vitis vinifera TaxID=29760 RepID=A0A438EYA6_VITVI|nr:MDIS1-interacting receptor like kinase 2 [Vitis vinifera]
MKINFRFHSSRNGKSHQPLSYTRINNLTGPIPSTFGNLKRLTVLYLFNNSLSGPIPPEIGNLKSLQGLSLYENNLSGPIPVSLCDLSGLTLLHLYANQLSGPIPQEIGNLKSLVDLELSENQLNGSIPTSLVGCARNGHKPAVWLFTGRHLPRWISGALYSEYNHLSGPIPKSLKNCKNLTRALFQGNQLTGNISEVVGESKPGIHRFELQQFHGELSHNWGRGPQLQGWRCREQYTGSIPEDFGISTDLTLLDLSSNHLVGEIPKKMGSVTSLWKLILNDNQLSGIYHPNLDRFLTLARSESQLAYRWHPATDPRVATLQICSGVDQQPVKKSHKVVFIIIFPLLGALVLLFAFIGIFLIAERRERTPEIEEGEVQNDLFSISTFDGRTMYEEIIKATKDFDPMYCIGKGGHGSVYKAELPSSNIVAVKKLHPSDTEMADQKDFLNEIRALTEIKHRNIVKLLGFCSHPRHKFLVYEYLERGSLATILSREEAKKLGWATRVNIIKGVAHALAYMHHDCSPPIVHRDISSNNILLDSQYEAHISDFGTAKLLKLDSSNQSYLQAHSDILHQLWSNSTEVIKGRHPGDQILSLSVSPEKDNIVLEDMLDPRLPPLTPQDEGK